MKEDLKMLTKGHIIALLAIFAVMLAYVTAISWMQHESFEKAKASQPEMVYLQNSDGTLHAVPREDYERANEQWRQEHPEDYEVLEPSPQ